MDSNRKRQLPPSPPPQPDPATPVMGELARPARKRWRDCFLAIREDINLQASFFRRVQSRPLIFRRIFVVQFEQSLRRVVREELQRIIYNSNLPPRPPPNENNQVKYKLVFLNKIKSTIFERDIIEGENGEPIKIAICDIKTQQIISHKENYLSSAKLKIVTLNAEYWKIEKENWSHGDFVKSILHAREGKEPILKGEINFRLENGEKMIHKLEATDNSKWTKSGFRLGVMVEIENERVLEGISEPFIVMARGRSKGSQKPNRLLLSHNVQCLREIGNKRALDLEKKNIITVYDFLFCYHKEQALIRQILGIKSEDDKGWKTIVKHAMECNTEFHAYNALNGINLFPVVAMDNQNIISDPNVHQIQVADPNSNHYDDLMHAEFDGQFGTGQEVSFYNQNIIWDQNAHQFQMAPPNNNNYGGEFRISQEVPSNIFARISGSHFVGSSSSEPNPSENNIIPQGVSNGGIGLSGIASYDMEDIFRLLDSTPNNANIFGVGSFNSNRYVKGPFSPRQKAKIRAIVRFNLPARKKARLETPGHQIGVPAT